MMKICWENSILKISDNAYSELSGHCSEKNKNTNEEYIRSLQPYNLYTQITSLLQL